MPSHPLQSALDRATQAAFTVVDLLDIAAERQPATGTRRSRPDARQTSLYKAVVTAAIGGLEEAFEGMAAAGLAGLGLPARATPVVERMLAMKMQNPNSSNVKGLLMDFVGFDPATCWQAQLRTSQPSYRLVSGTVALETFYGAHEVHAGTALSGVLDRFVNVRHSFAHQDSSKGVLTQQELTKFFGPLRTAAASTAEQKRFVKSLSAVCAVRLKRPVSPTEDPIARWTVHETHALNALHLLVGVVSTTVSGLAEHLEREHRVAVAAHDPLVLRVQRGAWEDQMDSAYFPPAAYVSVELVPYKPLSR